MNLLNFIESYPDEASCKAKFKEYREQVGVICPKCGNSNAKKTLLNTHHDVKPEFSQKYLDEFCYKFNRRYFGEALFNRLLVACV